MTYFHFKYKKQEKKLVCGEGKKHQKKKKMSLRDKAYETG